MTEQEYTKIAEKTRKAQLDTHEFEVALRGFAEYLKCKGYTLRQIHNIVRNISALEIDQWNEQGGE